MYEPYQHFRMGKRLTSKTVDLGSLVFTVSWVASLPYMWDRTVTICSAGKTTGMGTGTTCNWMATRMGLRTFSSCAELVCSPSICTSLCSYPDSGKLFYVAILTLLYWWRQEALARSLEIQLERLNTDESFFKSLPKLMKSKRSATITCRKFW